MATPRFKLVIDRSRLPLSTENEENEKIAIGMAEEIFEIITRKYIAHGARALAYALSGMSQMKYFSESYDHAIELTMGSIEAGLIDITVEELL